MTYQEFPEFWEMDDLSAEELGELAVIQYAEDPDVEFDELDLTQDASAPGHGENSEEEMMFTLEDA